MTYLDKITQNYSKEIAASNKPMSTEDATTAVHIVGKILGSFRGDSLTQVYNNKGVSSRTIKFYGIRDRKKLKKIKSELRKAGIDFKTTVAFPAYAPTNPKEDDKDTILISVPLDFDYKKVGYNKPLPKSNKPVSKKSTSKDLERLRILEEHPKVQEFLQLKLKLGYL